jgi:hypothetical protein
MSLNYPISQIPTSIESKCAIFNTLFNFSAPLGAVNAYMNYYTQQCDLVSQRNRELYSRLEHYDMCDIAGRLIDGMPIQIAHSDWSNSRLGQHAQAAVFLVCQLLTMVDVPYAQLLSLENYEHVKTLEQFLGKIFPRSAAMVDVRKRIKPGLIARNISESAKIQINWTENLADHLKLESGGKTLHIFHRVSFLESQAKMCVYPLSAISQYGLFVDVGTIVTTTGPKASFPKPLKPFPSSFRHQMTVRIPGSKNSV